MELPHMIRVKQNFDATTLDNISEEILLNGQKNLQLVLQVQPNVQ